jgi:excisionase family DNA binding protein
LTRPTAADRNEHRDAYSIPEVCSRVAAGRSYIYGEIRAGRLRARKLGRLTRILAADLAAWLAAAPAIAEPTLPPPAAALQHPRRR